jgi:hypothetical protein
MTQTQKTEKKYTVQELADRWDCKAVTVYSYVSRGKRGVRLSPISPSKHIFVESDVVAFEQKVCIKRRKNIKRRTNIAVN